jgi:hypothetical protein
MREGVPVPAVTTNLCDRNAQFFPVPTRPPESGVLGFKRPCKMPGGSPQTGLAPFR